MAGSRSKIIAQLDMDAATGRELIIANDELSTNIISRSGEARIASGACSVGCFTGARKERWLAACYQCRGSRTGNYVIIFHDSLLPAIIGQ